MDDFYITLPSNVKNENYENTIANFKTKLATTLKLDDNWRVGIASISYTKSWTVEAEIASFEFVYYHLNFKSFKSDKFKIDLSQYSDVKDIIKEINKLIDEYESSETVFKFPRFQINALTNRVEIKTTFQKNCIILPKMSDNLCKVLGFDKHTLDNYIYQKHNQYRHEWDSIPIREQFNLIPTWEPKEPNQSEYIYISENPYNILPTFSTLYVYCDLVKHNFVGDSFTQLMRIVEVPPSSKFRDQLLFNYTNIHYMPLQVKEFDTIEINIKDDLGRTIPFLFGRTIISLHFKSL